MGKLLILRTAVLETMPQSLAQTPRKASHIHHQPPRAQSDFPFSIPPQVAVIDGFQRMKSSRLIIQEDRTSLHEEEPSLSIHHVHQGVVLGS
ncbi:hypothetical protein BJX96DRAFT_143926 [Aspergillus floccosus]